MEIFDIFLLEAALNGLLFGGVLALLALGLNLIFGVIDVVWICYAELVMLGMYTVYYLFAVYGWPLPLAFAAGILLVAFLGAALHWLVIRPVLASEPINQLLVTGGVLFFLQALATLLFGVDFRNLGLSLPSLVIGDIFLPWSRILAAGTALIAMLGVWLFLRRSFTGTAIRAISQDRTVMPLMGANPERLYLLTSAIGGALAGLSACLLVLQYDVHLHGLRDGRAREPPGRLHRRFHLRPVHRPRWLLLPGRVGLRHGLRLLHRGDVRQARGPVRPAAGLIVPALRPLAWIVGIGAIACLPLTGIGDYHLHLAILILLWAFVYTAWSIMGRFGLTSLGHGAFLGIGAYGVVLLWNGFGLTPWLGLPAALVVTAGLAFVIGWPCFRFRITGHYFALVTLALSEVVRLLIVAMRDWTGGSLGTTPQTALTAGQGISLVALQFASKAIWFWIVLALWVVGLLIWRAVDRSMARYALEAVGQDEDAAAAIGIDVTRTKLTVLLVSALMTCVGGAFYAQYQLYVNPETVSGIAISLQIVFAAIAGGMFVQLGPTVGAVFTLLLAESLRVAVGHDVHGLDGTIYGLMLVLFIIYMPKGVLGKVLELARARPRPDIAATETRSADAVSG
jgi:branched-chain amino acid transport system permease protein